MNEAGRSDSLERPAPSRAQLTENADGLEPHEVALRELWRELAEKRIEQGVDWPRIVLTLFGDIDRLTAGYVTAALAAESELKAQEERHWANVSEHTNQAYAQGRQASIAQVASERDAALAEVARLRAALAAQEETGK